MAESLADGKLQRQLLKVEHVAKAFGRRQVLKDASISVKPGEIIAITGENGSGKSTLLNLIVGRIRADSGSIVCEGRLGFCPQELLIFEGLTVEENLRYFATAYDLPRRDPQWQARAGSLTDRFRCSQYMVTTVSRLSGGTKQKLNLILAFLHSPDLLILDEPYAGFDWETYIRFWEYARELRAGGKSILVVAHLVFDSARLDAVYRLQGGILECA